jgi:hypothetical protein
VSPLEERECLQPSGTCRPSADPQAVQPEHLRRLLADPTDRPGTPVETSEGPPVWKMPDLELSPRSRRWLRLSTTTASHGITVGFRDVVRSVRSA